MYKLKTINKTHEIIETKKLTKEEHVVYRSDDLEKVKKLIKKLKDGGGFNGWTPEFLVLP